MTAPTGDSTQSIVNRPASLPPALKITFWGTQGSVPIFPQLTGVHEYARRTAVDALLRCWEDLSERVKSGLWDAREMLAQPPNLARVEDYQRQLGLVNIPIYGGDTTCCEIITDEGDTILIDAGTAVRNAARSIVARTADTPGRTIHLLGTHPHLDHRGGLPFAQFCYERKNPFHVRVYSTHGFLSTLDSHYGIFSHELSDITHIDDPVDYRMMAATFSGVELRNPAVKDWNDGKPSPWEVRDAEWVVRIGNVAVRTIDVYHGQVRCLAYRIDYKGKSFVFCTDHELRHGPDPTDPRQVKSLAAEDRLRRFCQNVDVAYFDGQYMREEYDGKKGVGEAPKVPKIDWGHSCIEDCIERATGCQIPQTFIGHHDPEREWPERLQLDEMLAAWSQGKPTKIKLAKAEQVVEL